MSDRKTSAAAAIGGFGAALAGLGGAPAADAALVGLNFTPATVGTGVYFPVFVSGTAAGTSFGGFLAVNTGPGTGQFAAFGSAGGGISYFTFVASGQAIASTPTTVYVNLAYSTGSTALVGFGTTAGQFGWIRVDISSLPGGAYTFIEGAIETDPGVGIFAGEGPTADVPLPATLPLAALGTLALGAAGLRRRRAA